MKIQYCSDLHLEFPDNKRFMETHPIIPNGEILILAGDIVPFQLIEKHADFFNYISENFKSTYWIPGNHEYYGYDLANKRGAFIEKIRANVFLVNNLLVQEGDINLIFSTLWTDISPQNEWFISQNISDFRVIKYNSLPFTTLNYNEQHRECLRFITDAVKQVNKGKTLVVTHHAPTQMNYPEQYKGSRLNEAFAVELYDFIFANNVDYWIYGHHHYNTPSFSIGHTTMLTNQLGYIQYREDKNYRRDIYIDF